jgi:hypothetical protein
MLCIQKYFWLHSREPKAFLAVLRGQFSGIVPSTGSNISRFQATVQQHGLVTSFADRPIRGHSTSTSDKARVEAGGRDEMRFAVLIRRLFPDCPSFGNNPE